MWHEINVSSRKITWNWWACWEWIASELVLTTANGLVIKNGAGCESTASADTRVYTTFIDTSQIASTFWIGHTFGTTIWYTSNVIWQTRADSHFVHCMAIAVWTAGRWNTWIWGDCCDWMAYFGQQVCFCIKTVRLEAHRELKAQLLWNR